MNDNGLEPNPSDDRRAAVIAADDTGMVGSEANVVQAELTELLEPEA